MFINKGLKWPISNGEAVSVWGDFWLASSPLRALALKNANAIFKAFLTF